MIHTPLIPRNFFIAPMHSSRHVEHSCHTTFGLNRFRLLAKLGQSRMASCVCVMRPLIPKYEMLPSSKSLEERF